MPRCGNSKQPQGILLQYKYLNIYMQSYTTHMRPFKYTTYRHEKIHKNTIHNMQKSIDLIM